MPGTSIDQQPTFNPWTDRWGVIVYPNGTVGVIGKGVGGFDLSNRDGTPLGIKETAQVVKLFCGELGLKKALIAGAISCIKCEVPCCPIVATRNSLLARISDGKSGKVTAHQQPIYDGVCF